MQFLAFLDDLDALTVHPFDSAELTKTRRVLATFSDQTLTLADAHGLAMMKDRGNKICWSHMGLTSIELAAR
jgi:hypothetical protein